MGRTSQGSAIPSLALCDYSITQIEWFVNSFFKKFLPPGQTTPVADAGAATLFLLPLSKMRQAQIKNHYSIAFR